MEAFSKEEKKVEYLELIYDLIFVYMVGRNNSLLHHFENGFVTMEYWVAYIVCTLAIIQIWNFTTFYINLFGRNGIRDHIFLFINMYLMYFIGESTRSDWFGFQAQYHIAWGLILVNIGVQYLLELRNHQADVWNRDMIKRMMFTLFSEAFLVLCSAFLPMIPGVIVSAAAIFMGIFLTFLGRSRGAGLVVDFMHLTERAMLYVVFTFGEMIIALAGYFTGDGSFDLNTVYYSLMAFLIVVGLFFSYGIVYDHLLDREKDDNGLIYMVIHILILFALNNITTALEFMREEDVALLPKMLLMVLSVVGYYVFLFCTGKYAKSQCGFHKAFIMKMIFITLVFIAIMILLRKVMAVNIFVTVLYVFCICGVLYRAKRNRV